MAQITEFLSPTWEVQTEFLASDFCLTQPWLLCCYEHLWSDPAQETYPFIFFVFSLSIFFKKLNFKKVDVMIDKAERTPCE